MAERIYPLVRITAGDYLLPSNDGRELWRIYRYHEDGSLEDGDGSRIRGDFWGAARYRYGSPEQAVHDEDLTEWNCWDIWVTLLRTRQEAIEEALHVDLRRSGASN
jgi:hypothetical protein